MGDMGFMAIFYLTFFLAFGLIAFVILRNVAEWGKNNRSPRLTVGARVVAKRAHSSRHDHSTSTAYYVTFEVESGDRMELRVNGTEYGMLVEGDCGTLSFQGTRYLSFERNR